MPLVLCLYIILLKGDIQTQTFQTVTTSFTNAENRDQLQLSIRNSWELTRNRGLYQSICIFFRLFSISFVRTFLLRRMIFMRGLRNRMLQYS